MSIRLWEDYLAKPFVVNDDNNLAIKNYFAMSNIQPLRHELQIDGVLNNSVHSHRRADFALMLAMMSDDVLDQVQFQLAEERTDIVVDEEKRLRKELNLPEKRCSLFSQTEKFDFHRKAECLKKGGVSAIKLADYLRPEAINLKDDFTTIDESVLENCSLHTRTKLNKTSLADFGDYEKHGEIKKDETRLYEWLDNFDAEKPIKLTRYKEQLAQSA